MNFDGFTFINYPLFRFIIQSCYISATWAHELSAVTLYVNLILNYVVSSHFFYFEGQLNVMSICLCICLVDIVLERNCDVMISLGKMDFGIFLYFSYLLFKSVLILNKII